MCAYLFVAVDVPAELPVQSTVDVHMQGDLPHWYQVSSTTIHCAQLTTIKKQ